MKTRLIKILKSYPFVRVIIEFSGKYDFEIGIVSKNIEELDRCITKIIDDIAQYSQEYQILVISKYYESRTFPGSFLDLENNVKLQKSNPELKTDKIDLDILKILSENARLPLYEIGSAVKLSADAVNYRIKKMLNNGLILKFMPIINYSVLGYTVYTIIMNIHNLSLGKEKTLK